jgi:hypothetical protein
MWFGFVARMVEIKNSITLIGKPAGTQGIHEKVI